MSCFNDSSCLVSTTGVAPQTFSAALQFFAAATCLLPDKWQPNPTVSALPLSDNCILELFGDGTRSDIKGFPTEEHLLTEPRLSTNLEGGDDKSEGKGEEIDSDTNSNGSKFDFIIVGAGASGSVVANRLSENNKWNILLIEAGEVPPLESKIPALDKAMFGTKYDWRYKTTFNGITNKANKNNSINWTRGKMLGGSTNINGMLYVRGNRQDFQRWYDAGNKEWHPDEVYKYFKKVENLQDRDLLNQTDISNTYGHCGHLPILRFNSTLTPLSDKILAAYNELGIKNVPDLNTADVLGSGIITVTAHDGLRASADRSYLLPIQERQNLKILTNTLVTKVLINDRNTANGVEVEQDSEIYQYMATKEVIVCAGAINTPQLLMLSGIGPRGDLESKNIRCVADLPVGQNLQDHCSIPVTIFGDGPRDKDQGERSMDTVTYLFNRTGDLAQNSFTDVLAFYSRDSKASYPEFENHLIIFRQNSSTVERAFSTVFNYEDSIVQEMVKNNKEHTLYNFLFNLLHPRSMGNVTLNSTDPKVPPNIYANYFSDPRDLDLAVAGLQILSKIRFTGFFKSINAFLGRMKWTLCDKFELDTKQYWECVCINMVYTVYHPVGTARMGCDPSDSVVDSRLKVHNVKNLRVIDASVMPNIISGNTQAACYMIGERGADLVKEDHEAFWERITGFLG